ncbi:hypothetical protein [Streptomyces sp. MBT53]|uniref:hypothetical protein n=1 Tax=Streptomyces sp. MBT53 TaxID=1488384 RepID=UPI0019132CE6|nr:hypothetical protein [Streptomyces sp. MBT53]MBK6014269.1 hypothetical protein [Streptomyces sp. MBT53]
MTPPAARAAVSAHLTDTLGLPPNLATHTASELLDRLAVEGWQITTTPTARPVAPRARETRRARRLVARLLPHRVRPNGETER